MNTKGKGFERPEFASLSKCADEGILSPRSLPLRADERERPSRHGAILGQALAALADLGRLERPDLPPTCATCAFRPGCMTNQMASTGIMALNCVLGLDTDRFACHHGMAPGGEPKQLCAGYIAAMLAPFDATKAAVEWVHRQLTDAGPDEVRAEFDAWVLSVDPDNVMDDYQRGRAFLRARPMAARASGLASPLGDSGREENLKINEAYPR